MPSRSTQPWDPGADPELVAMFPKDVDGFALQGTSAATRDAGGSGDICGIVCPEQPPMFAKAAGANADTMTFAIVIPSTGRQVPDWAIYAIRAPGADPSRLVAA